MSFGRVSVAGAGSLAAFHVARQDGSFAEELQLL
jgi:hypothetical protein